MAKDTPGGNGSRPAGMSRWMTNPPVRSGAVPWPWDDTDRKERTMPRLDLGAVRATWRVALRRLDAWTLETLNSPAGGGRPRQ